VNNLFFSRIKHPPSLRSYVHYVEDFCSLDLCDRFIEESLFRRKHSSIVGNNTLDRTIRDACDLEFSKADPLRLSLEQCFRFQLNEYLKKFNFVSVTPESLTPEITFVSYTNQKGYVPHTDALIPFNEKGQTRFISIVSYLNDDYVGGDIYFPEIGVSLKPKKGSCVIFPSDDLFKHGVKPIRGYKLISPCWFYGASKGINPFVF